MKWRKNDKSYYNKLVMVRRRERTKDEHKDPLAKAWRRENATSNMQREIGRIWNKRDGEHQWCTLNPKEEPWRRIEKNSNLVLEWNLFQNTLSNSRFIEIWDWNWHLIPHPILQSICSNRSNTKMVPNLKVGSSSGYWNWNRRFLPTQHWNILYISRPNFQSLFPKLPGHLSIHP